MDAAEPDSDSSSSSSSPPPQPNPLREVPLRYLGYANEVGEAFRYQVPKLVVPSYVVAFGYCIMDAGLLAKKGPVGGKVMTFVDTLIWQSLASVMIPGAMINMVVKGARTFVGVENLKKPGYKFVPTALGLGVIPLIVHPIDYGVEVLMDETLRKLYK